LGEGYEEATWGGKQKRGFIRFGNRVGEKKKTGQKREIRDHGLARKGENPKGQSSSAAPISKKKRGGRERQFGKSGGIQTMSKGWQPTT